VCVSFFVEIIVYFEVYLVPNFPEKGITLFFWSLLFPSAIAKVQPCPVSLEFIIYGFS
jgi:hypothetical protein